MPTIKFTATQIERMLVTKAREAAATLGVEDMVDPDKGYSVETFWKHVDKDSKVSNSSEDFNPYRSYIEVKIDERY